MNYAPWPGKFNVRVGAQPIATPFDLWRASEAAWQQEADKIRPTTDVSVPDADLVERVAILRQNADAMKPAAMAFLQAQRAGFSFAQLVTDGIARGLSPQLATLEAQVELNRRVAQQALAEQALVLAEQARPLFDRWRSAVARANKVAVDVSLDRDTISNRDLARKAAEDLRVAYVASTTPQARARDALAAFKARGAAGAAESDPELAALMSLFNAANAEAAKTPLPAKDEPAVDKNGKPIAPAETTGFLTKILTVALLTAPAWGPYLWRRSQA